jgi:ribosome biogenesis SPOUT family RNA methylase Rps3
MTDQKTQQPKAFVVEHLDPELGPWSALEYAAIARESHANGARFLLSSVPAELQMPAELAATKGLEVEQRGVEEIFADRKDKVCLLDPSAKTELSPEDGDVFEVFLFGGILGMKLSTHLGLYGPLGAFFTPAVYSIYVGCGEHG